MMTNKWRLHTSAFVAAALLSGCATTAVDDPSKGPPVIESVEIVDIKPPKPPEPIRPAEQWLFGSAEAAALIVNTYDELTAFGLEQAKKKPSARRSVVLAPNQRLNSQSGDFYDPVTKRVMGVGAIVRPTPLAFTDCGAKPPAIVFDADETLIWNVGQARWAAEHAKGFNPKVWDEWERTGEGKVVPLPGAVEALTKLRRAGIVMVANTNREARNAAQTTATLKAAGLGDFVHGETLFLKGDDATGSAKDMRRDTISSKYCVIAMVGDQLGDFAQAFNEKGMPANFRAALATEPRIAALWGKGWFLLPNPTYGPWDHVTYDDAFPATTRWAPKEGQ